MNGRLTRRDLLKRGVAGGAVLSLPALYGVPDALAAALRSESGKTLTISNWPLYIDVNEKTKKRPTIEQFQKKFGIKVKYIEDINSNAAFFGKIQGSLSRGASTGRDIIVMTDNSPYPALLVQKGWVEKLDKSVLPNIKNLQDNQKHPAWDKNRDYSLPWQSGMTGIGYNAKLTKPITSVEQLLTDKKLHGKVTLLDDAEDTLGLVMLENGDDPAHVTDASWDRAYKKVEAAVKSGQVRQFTGNDYSGLLAKGDIIAAVVWSGDMVQLHADNKSLRFVLPKAGGIIWTDNMLIPKGGDAHTASIFMNYVYDPKIAAQIEDYVNYICPVKGADKVLLKTDPAVAKDPLIFPPAAMRARLHQNDPKALFNGDYKTKWQKLLGA
jgi:spermidine/putrescine transport system substrate-binding protein